ncbi:alpha/beta hydrolase [Limosilactobacillus reuteri]|uniref:Proline iminopeptidase n=1 Tax=Limosilactobacillus reuteri TaxID=1598 RepID=A0A317GJJ3_LIMRT|nr:proline iminopeptidase-family hydrolase [Limosilactobacillus reuteri]MCH5384282.1 proline iminopeptidase-family hydrolase [Limosilactobacillus reuteri]PWT49017.1 alpha/beta hydrolase [Limosilactobacillus reuteri]PWT53726.1 alpha/beta hydrolase [Limosilactobacillus reuteri]PWT64240.1 alpha/beta hydrolase [Limosilactobacillus reuteri]
MKRIQEGYMPFGRYQTYYRIVGKPSKKTPLLLLHGDPGSTHNYFEVLDDLAEKDGRQLIMYDQIGCGKSSMPDEKADEVYTAKTWLEELKTLRAFLNLDKIHLLGQSWGGMLELIYLCDEKPEGIKSGILASTLPASWMWDQELHRLIKFMDFKDQQAIAKAEKEGNYTSKEYLQANERFMELHCNDATSATDLEPLRRKKRSGTVAYLTGWGPNEYNPEGNLRNYNYLSKLSSINIPTLITSGTDDLCTPFIAKAMYDLIPNTRWYLYEGCRHMSFIEKHDEYESNLIKWLNEND